MNIDKKTRQILEKHGGNLPMRVRDSETGEVLFNNSDATAMAKRFVSRGGYADDNNRIGWTSWDDLAKEVFMEVYSCPQCKNPQYHFINGPQDGQKFTDGTVGFRCTFCWKDSECFPYKSEEHKKECELKRPFVDRYVDAYKSMDTRIEILKEYLEFVKNNEKGV